MFSGEKLKNRTEIPNEDLFFKDHQIFATEINCSTKWVAKLP